MSEANDDKPASTAAPKPSRWTDVWWFLVLIAALGIAESSDFVRLNGSWWPPDNSIIGMLIPFSVILLVGGVGLFLQYRKNPVAARALSQVPLRELICLPPLVLVLLMICGDLDISRYAVAPFFLLLLLWSIWSANRSHIHEIETRVFYLLGSTLMGLGLVWNGALWTYCLLVLPILWEEHQIARAISKNMLIYNPFRQYWLVFPGLALANYISVNILVLQQS